MNRETSYRFSSLFCFEELRSEHLIATHARPSLLDFTDEHVGGWMDHVLRFILAEDIS